MILDDPCGPEDITGSLKDGRGRSKIRVRERLKDSGFEDEGSTGKGCRWPLEAREDKETDSPQSLRKEQPW